ncbi:MAG: GNAT family N-acetyltransferase [Firmicutes bacterium]|nr:GNAT family N-acetyltransferase [Bacillota bacterium]
MHIIKDNITIRNAAANDADILYVWWNDGKVMSHAGFPNGLGTTTDKIKEQLKSDSDETGRRCIIEIDSIPVGEMNYRNKGNKTAEIGIKICNFSKQNNGYGSKILRLFIQSLFEDYGYETIILDTNFENKRAQHVYEKLGFVRTRMEMDSWKNQVGELQSQIYYELKKEWFYADC